MSDQSQAPVREITTREAFQKALAEAGDKLVVAGFHAAWCAPCRKMTPEFEKMASSEEKFSGVVFLGVDSTENVATAEYYNVNVLPTFILYRNGLKVERFTGADPQKLRQFVEDHL